MKTLYRMINALTLILLSIALFFSLQSSTFTFFGLSRTLYALILLTIPVAFLLLVFPPVNLFKRIWQFIKNNNNIIFWLIFSLLVVMQLVLVNTFKIDVTSDANIILTALDHPSRLSNYLSLNSNNSFYFFLSYFLSKIFGTNLIVFEIYAIVSLDLSVIFLKLATHKYFGSRSIANVVTLIFAYFTMLQPIFVLTYTDTFVLPFINLTILLIVLAFNDSKAKYLFMVLAGISTSIAYLLKPSAIIFLIALIIFFVISKRAFLGKVNGIRTALLLLMTLFLTGTISTYAANRYMDTQTIVKIDKSKSFPIVHYALLGSFGDPNDKNSLHGTFNNGDLSIALKAHNKTARTKAELNELISRSHHRGIIESFKFYMAKFSDNMDTGVVGFHREQLWSIVTKLAPKNSINGHIEKIFYDREQQPGNLLSWSSTFLFLLQLIWLVILSSAIYAIWKYRESDKITLVSLSLLGGMLFLLIFESGGTKYMLQYTPFISVLAGFGLYNLLTQKHS